MTQHSDRLSKFFWHIIGPRQAWLWGLLATEFVGALVMNLVGPYFLKKIIDAAAAANEFRAGLRAMVDGPGLIYVSLFLVAAVNYRAMDWMRRALLPLVRQHIILDMFAYIKRHSSRMFADNFAGSLSNMIFDMANGAVSIFSRSVEMFGGAAVLVIGVVTMYMVHPLCALVFLLWAVTFVGSSLYYIRHIVSLSQNFSEHRTTLVGRVVDSLSNIGNIRLFARYSYEHAQLRHMADHNVALDRAMQLAVFKMRIAQDLSIVLFMGALLGILIHLYQGGMVSAGDFAMLLNVALGTFQITWHLADQGAFFAEEWGRCAQALTLIATPHEIADARGAASLEVSAGRIEFERVSFRYQRNRQLFKNKSLAIAAGQKVGLVGVSGSGKTSFVNLILRTYEVEQGRILIDGQDIARVTQESLHQAIAMIPQDTSLFHRSLMENIRYGKLDASDAQVMAAARQANCDEFIDKLPQGYAAMVGERGVKLSGGQRQRIAIARAILKDAPILILDEATSALDSVTERTIQDTLQSLMQGRTTIVIAHRLSTLAQMDRILVFGGGTIIEDGTHEGLLAAGGEYARMWRMQASGFLPEAA